MWSFPWAIQPVGWRKVINYDCTCVPRPIHGGCDIHCSLKGKIGCWGTARRGGPTCSKIGGIEKAAHGLGSISLKLPILSHTQDIRFDILLYNYDI